MQAPVNAFELLRTLVLEINQVSDLESALNKTIETICKHCYWSYGEAWRLNPKTQKIENLTALYDVDIAKALQNSRLKAEEHQVPASPNRFAQVSKSCSFELGKGIPGRLWVSQQWEWHKNVSKTAATAFVRHQAATAFGIKTAFGLPLIINERTIAVLVFCSHLSMTQNSTLIETMQAISDPISQLLKKVHTEQKLKEIVEQSSLSMHLKQKNATLQ